MVSAEEPSPGSGAADLPREVDRYLRQLTALADVDGSDAPVAQAAAWAQVQRVSAWGLRAAVELARERKVGWRELAQVINVPASTLHRQYQSGQALIAASSAGAADRPDPGAGPGTEPDPTGTSPVGPEDEGWPGAAGSAVVRPLNLFVGRERELADLRLLLARRQRRLVTLTGTAGVGKTRLAVELVHELAGSFRGGRWWAELAPLADAGSLPSAVTAAAGTGAAGRTLDQVLHAACAEGPVLLVLDNCEHLVAGCAEFAGRLLGAYPKLSIVATSREPLQVPGELQVRLEPLQPVPAGADDARVLESAAARLFADRAREVVYDFDAAAHAAAIARICNGLDGLPLAIELAAHQVAILAPQVQASRLADPLSWLSTQERNPLRRRSGLRAAIGWSYELLDPVERAVFRRLTVLPGGSDQVTAAVLCGGLGLDRAGLWAILAGLAGKSLLYPDPAVPGRFRILEALRAFGREQLDADGETAAVHGLLIDWLAEVHARFEPDMWSASFQRRRELLDWAEREQANAAYALQHARQAGDVRYPDLALLLSIVWNLLSEAGKALPVLMDLLAHPGLPDAAQANAHLSLCYVLRVQGDFQAARRHGQQSLDVARRTGDDRLVCRALGHLVVATAELDLDEGLQLSRELIALLRELGDSAMLSGRLEDHAWMLFLAGDIDAAQEIAEEALALDAPGPFFLHTVGAIALQTGDLRRAEECFTGALTEAGTLSLDASFQIEGLALVAVRQHRYEHALQLLAACSALRTARAIPEDPHWTPYLAEGRRVAVEALPASVAAAADELGSGLSIEETIVLALEGRLPDRHTLRAAGPLTRREMQIAELIAAGHTTKQIAARLYISPRTVGTTLARINDKLGLANRVQLAAWMTSNAPDPT